MTSPNKKKGDNAELEVQKLLRELLNIPTIRRELGAGRLDDRGDIAGVPNTAIQVAHRRDVPGTIRAKVEEVEQQRRNKRVRFAACFIRWNNAPWVVVMSPRQWRSLWHYAQIGLRWEKSQIALGREILDQSAAVTQAAQPTRMASHEPNDEPAARRPRTTGSEDNSSKTGLRRSGDRTPSRRDPAKGSASSRTGNRRRVRKPSD